MNPIKGKLYTRLPLWSDLHGQGKFYGFQFRGAQGSQVWGALQFATNWHGYVDFIDTDWAMNHIPQAQVDATRPVMRRIETALAERCGLVKLQTVQEECRFTTCAPLVD